MLETRHLMQALEAAGADGNVVYVSVPITSGRREIALLDELGMRDAQSLRRSHAVRWSRDVLHENEAAARRHAAEVRSADWARDSIIIDPSRMKVEGWSQDDYNAFWVELMRKHVRRLVLTPDWAFSRGARIEAGLAIALGIDLVDINGVTLPAASVEDEAEAARRSLEGSGWSRAEVDAYIPPLSISTPDLRPSAQSDAFAWLIAERQYQVATFGQEADDERTRDAGLQDAGWWRSQLEKYWAAAQELGLDESDGRLALAKFVATACGLLESTVRVKGPIGASRRDHE